MHPLIKRVQVLKNHMLAQNLYYNHNYPKGPRTLVLFVVVVVVVVVGVVVIVVVVVVVVAAAVVVVVVVVVVVAGVGVGTRENTPQQAENDDIIQWYH